MGVLASFNGQSVFGASVECLGPAIVERREQRNNYAGVNGTESLDMGDNVAITVVKGRLYSNSLPSLNAARAALLSLMDGNAYTLIDNLGNEWPNVKMIGFEPEGRGEPTPDAIATYSFRYVARFAHLTLS